MIDQKSFERGLEIGLRTALVIIGDGLGAQGIQRQIDEIKESQAARGLTANKSMVEADIFMPQPLAHPGDFGLPATAIDEERVALSRMSWATPPSPSPDMDKSASPDTPKRPGFRDA